MKLDLHDQYIQDIVCLKLTVPSGDIDPERLARALKHLRSRFRLCESCTEDAIAGRMHPMEHEFLAMCEDPRNPAGIVQELVDAMNKKHGGRRVARDDSVR